MIAQADAYLTFKRVLVIFSCRTYISRSLFRDLKTLAATSSDAEDDVEYIQLEGLPTPSTSQSPANDSAITAKKGPSSLHTKVAFWVFSFCFSDCCILFCIFLFQEIGMLSAPGRMLSWKVSLHLIVADLLFVIPLCSNLLLTYQSPVGKYPHYLVRHFVMNSRLLLFAFLPCVVYLYFFSMIPIPEGVLTTSPVEQTLLARIVVVGTFTIGLFSGLGAAVNMARFLPTFRDSRSTIPTASEIASAEEALARIRKDLTRREEQAKTRTEQSSGPSWMSRVLGNSDEDSSSIQREIDGLIALEYQMSRNVEELRQSRAEHDYSRSSQGRILHVIGVIFSIYCVFRTASSIFNVFAPFRTQSSEGRSYPDLVSHLLTYLFSLLPSVKMSPDHIAATSRQISLALVGAIILTSIRFVLRLVSRVLRLTSQSLGASLLLLILAQMMGTYLISTLVQLRTAFPPKPNASNEDQIQTNVLTLLPPYEMFGSAFDWPYLLSLSATGAYIWFDRKLNNTL
ncbi:hypothetical protein SCHPADRAFT_820833 [Schizopora paradoxa]|uniref:G protein-coupled receptor 89 n=1 Tax=Schizopora paradoxa TaxID=27342 RepID=A0A0H2SL04_9AGAM|nr:hypothetical protein SCHPADRAFT_820833 [Schizopora paradoxa]